MLEHARAAGCAFEVQGVLDDWMHILRPRIRMLELVRRLKSLILLGRPRLFGLLGRDESLTIPWREIETIGADAILVHTAVPEASAAPQGFWQQLRARLGL